MLLRLVILLLCSLCMAEVYGHADADTVCSRDDRYFLYYDRDCVDLQEDYLDNARQMARIKRVLSLSPRIDSIVVYVYSSPEGTLRHNNYLARERAKVARQFILDHLPNDSVLHPEDIILRPMGENWEGLKQEIHDNYHRKNRNRVLKILDAKINTETKKWRLHNLDKGKTFNYIVKHHMPILRKATWVMVYVSRPEFQADNTHVSASMAPVSLQPIDSVSADALFAPVASHHFKWALKTNLLYDAMLIPNLGAEFYLGHDISISANWHYAWWNTRGWFWRTYGGEVSLRYWLGSQAKAKPLSGHHIGLYGQVLTYDFMASGTGYMSGNPGEALFDRPSYSVGLEYGYSLPIARRLNLDFVIGLGYLRGMHNEYRLIDNCYVWQEQKKVNYFGPTKAEVTLVWLLGTDNINRRKGDRK